MCEVCTEAVHSIAQLTNNLQGTPPGKKNNRKQEKSQNLKKIGKVKGFKEISNETAAAKT